MQFYDILQKQSNVSRTVNAMMRSDSWNNAINSYCMVHFVYKLNVFGGKKNSKTESQDHNYGRPAYGRPGGHGYHGGYPGGGSRGRY